MSRFRSYSKRTSIGALVAATIAACATLSDSDVEEMTTYQSYSPNTSLLTKVSGSGATVVGGLSDDVEGRQSGTVLDEAEAKAARALFKEYCSSGKQTRKLVVPIRAVLPLPASGSVIDETSVAEVELRRTIQKRVASFFLDTATGPGLPSRYDFAYAKHSDGRSGLNGFAGVAFKTAKDLASCRGLTALEPDAIMFASDPKVYLAFSGVDQLSLPDKRAEIWNALPTAVFGRVTDRVLTAYDIDPSKSGHKRYKTKVERFAVQPLRFAETHFFPNYYTMLIPPAEQKDETGRSIWRDRHPTWTHFVTGSRFNLSEAVRDRHLLWQSYLSSFVHIKEAQTKDPRVIDYEASLDLRLFCAYGRPVDDLVSK